MGGGVQQALSDLLFSCALADGALGANHPDVALSLHGLARCLQQKGDSAAAIPVFRRSADIRAKAVAGAPQGEAPTSFPLVEAPPPPPPPTSDALSEVPPYSVFADSEY